MREQIYQRLRVAAEARRAELERDGRLELDFDDDALAIILMEREQPQPASEFPEDDLDDSSTVLPLLPRTLAIGVSPDGSLSINGNPITGSDEEVLTQFGQSAEDLLNEDGNA